MKKKEKITQAHPPSTATRQKQPADSSLNEQEFNRLILDSLSAPFFMYDFINRKFFRWNKTFSIVSGYSDEEIAHMKLIEFVPESEHGLLFNLFEEFKIKGHTSFEMTITSKDGTNTPYLLSGNLLNYEGNSYAVGMGINITDRKRVEHDLKQSEEMYRLLAEHMKDVVWITDLNLNVTYVSVSGEKILGWTQAEIRKMPLERLLTPESFKAAMDFYAVELPKALAAPPDYVLERALELQFVCKDGQTIWGECMFSLMRDDSGNPVSILGESRNITERKQIEQRLQASESNFRRSLDESPLGVRITSADGETVYANKAILDIYGYSGIDELKNTPLQERYTPASFAEAQKRKEKRLKGELGPLEYEISIVRKNGEVRHLRVFRKEIFWDGKKQYQVIYNDITEHRQAEEVLSKSEKKYASTFHLIPNPMAVTEVTTGEIVDVNQKFIDWTGYAREELIGLSTRDLNIWVNPADRDNVTSELTATGMVDGKEILLRKKNGSIRNVLFYARFIEIDEKRYLLTLAQDITERKASEDALKKSEALYRLLADNITEHIWIMDLKLNLTYISPSVEKIYGYSMDEIKKMSMKRLFTPESYQKIIELYAREIPFAMENQPFPGKRRVIELQAYHKNGHIIWVEICLSFIRDENGKPVSILGETQDITERKRAQALLKTSEEQYRLLADHMKDQVWLMDLNMNITYVSPSVERLTGYTSDEIKKLPWDKLLTPDSLKKALEFTSVRMPKAMKETAKDLIFRTIELEFILKSGQTLWGECSFSFIRDENGKVVSILGEARDITERKMAEEKLQQTLDSLKKAVGTTIQVLVSALESRDPYTAGHQSRSANLACAIAAEMGLDQHTIEGLRMAGIIHDIGKLSIPAEILSKPTRLTKLEFSLVKVHPESGYDMLKDVESPWPLAEIVHQHHERINGTGYPRNLKNGEILLEARIMAVADVVEAMASHRPYRASLGVESALEEIEQNRGILYDEAVVDACLRLFREKGYQLT